ncbi:ABC transporter permease [Arvimicrobium flavum]|uniref:ABC transporter permease n=1 Tax=Arvimicrobium flavum TaxID=3393320 RepID=UPI00237C4997|nr:iron ABC transporter permease [Mesorhizobium shangrilense]
MLLVLVLGPLLVLLITSVSPPGSVPLTEWNLTLQNFRDILALSDTWKIVLNTLQFALGSVLLGGLIALCIAWLTERTDMPFKTTIRVIMFSWMAIPPLVFGYGWVLSINPSNGVANNVAKALFDITWSPFSPYSMSALIVISALGLTPTAFVMISGLLRNMDPVLEQAGQVLGAKRWTVLRTITLPLMTPGMLAVGMYLIMGMVQTFDLPLIIGLSARIPVLSTRIYTLASPEVGTLPNYGLAAAFGVFLLVIAMIMMLFYFRATRISERFRVVTGKAYRPRPVRLGGFRYAALALVLAYVLVMLMPVLTLLWASLLPFYQAPSMAALEKVSLASYERILSSSMVLRSIANTAVLMILSATAVMVICFFVSWFSVRRRSAGSRWIDTLSFAPVAVPPIVMAIAVLLLYLRTPLYGTIWILLIGHVSVYIAFGSRTMTSAMLQLHKELEDAALISGAGWLTSLRTVVFPLLKGQVMNGWLWVLAHSARDLTFPLIMLSTSNVVAASAIWTMWDYPDLPGAAALAVLLVVAMMAFVIPLQLISARRQDA